MIQKLYAVKDLKTGYLPPTHDVNDDSAIRNFILACNANKNSTFFQFPGDYQLWCVGEFDTETGVITPDNYFVVDAPQHLDMEVEDVQNNIG